MRKKFLLMCLVGGLAATGCAPARSVSSGPAGPGERLEYELLWQAAVDVVGSRFAISSAEKDSGVIETAYLVGAFSMTGLKSNAVSSEAVREDMLHTLRRRAVVTLRRAGDAPLKVRVETARLVREHPDMVRGGRFSVQRGTDVPRRGEEYTQRWADTGRDEELEARIAAEIEKRYLAFRRAGAAR